MKNVYYLYIIISIILSSTYFILYNGYFVLVLFIISENSLKYSPIVTGDLTQG